MTTEEALEYALNIPADEEEGRVATDPNCVRRARAIIEALVGDIDACSGSGGSIIMWWNWAAVPCLSIEINPDGYTVKLTETKEVKK